MHLETGRAGQTCLIAAVAAALFLLLSTAAGAASPRLTRYPYLTDVVTTGDVATATINWATDQSQLSAYATYGSAGSEAATSHRVAATRASITVNGVPEYQWTAKISGLKPGSVYAYRTFLGDPGVDLLSGEPDPRFRTFSADPSQTFSFAVMGDWGANPSGTNPDQANLDAQVAATGASFVLSTGDVANPSGSQANYGDLQQTGPDLSNVFGPAFYKGIGGGIPLFGAPGNHGFNSTFLDVWPQTTGPYVSAGRYQMESYSLPGTNTASYPSVWYAFSIGSARFYILTAAWANSNVGSGTLYSNDRAAHWMPTSPEYQWLANDLATHPATVKFAVFHFPMYTDNATEASDTSLHGPDSLAELLGRYGVQFVFNGHAHIYERNQPQPGEGFVSYVVGGGGSLLEPVSLRGAFDAYAVGWSPTNNTGSARGAAPVPTSAAQVYSFLLVTVSPGQVKVNPIDSLGHSFDVQTYPIAGTLPPQDTTPPVTSASGTAPGVWLRGPGVVHLTATDGAGTGVAGISYSLDGASPVVVPASSVDVTVAGDGRHQLTYWATDLAGNAEEHDALSFGIDNEAPTSSASVPAGAWLRGPTVVHLAASDGVGSGVAGITCSLDGGSEVVSTGSSVDISVSGQGSHEISFWAEDAAGNEEAHKSLSLAIDGQAPSVSAAGVEPGAWLRDAALIHLQAVDAGDAGIASVRYSLDGGTAVVTPAASVDVAVAGEGRHQLTYWARDLAGNEETRQSLDFGIDEQAPVTTVDAAREWQRTPVTLSFAATDRWSGVQMTEVRVDGGDWQSLQPIVIPAPSDHSWDGVHSIVFRSVDVAGNVEPERTGSVRIDTRRPTTAAPWSASVRRWRTATLSYRIDDARPGSGRARVEIRIRTTGGRLVKLLNVGWRTVNRDGMVSFRCTLPRGTYRFQVYATDLAGNRQEKAGGNKLTVK